MIALNNSKDDSLTRKEFEQLWEAAKRGDEKDRLIFVCAGHLGMRANEIVELEKGWIDFQEQTLTIPRDVAKYEASARSLYYGSMNERVERVLSQYFQYHDDSEINNRNFIWRRVKNMSKRSELTRKVYPHALRSTCAFMLATAGFNAQGLKEFMGWSKLETAEKYIRSAGQASRQQLEDNADKLW